MKVEPQSLRAAMASFPTGVTVVTALGPDGPAGATANAVASLSLEPPLVLACLDLGSRTLVAVEHANRFGVNVLDAGQAALAQRFSTKEPHPRKWDGVPWTERTGAPMIDSALIRLGCELDEVHQGGDHVIAIGSVLELEARDGAPLIFHQGEYRGLDSGAP
jgi:flavin reductase (DIM6/NTAB) family NADH-FMN oxidoreductase RutF